MQQLSNPAIAAYLQTVLLTCARPGEVLALRWADINTQWKGINIRDKVEGNCEVPTTPCVLHLLSALPRAMVRVQKIGNLVTNPCVFSSLTSAGGHLTEPNLRHTRAYRTAGLEGPYPARPAPIVQEPHRMARSAGRRGGADSGLQAQRHRREVLHDASVDAAAPEP